MFSKDDEVIRGSLYELRMWGQPWPELPDPQPVPTIFPSLYYLHALGVVAARYNMLELYFVHLVGTIIGLKQKTIASSLTHVGAVTLIEMLKTVTFEEVESPLIADELRFCCLLFDVNRVNRNFVIHSAGEPNDIFPHPKGMLLTKRSARGKISIDHYRLPIETLREVGDELHEASNYLGLFLGALTDYETSKPIRIPDRPLLPTNLPQSLPKADMFDSRLSPKSPREGP